MARTESYAVTFKAMALRKRTFHTAEDAVAFAGKLDRADFVGVSHIVEEDMPVSASGKAKVKFMEPTA